MKLSKRLEMVASFVNEGSILADIGTDHGYIPIALVARGVSSHAIAMDVRTGPLKRAAAHVALHHLEDNIETRLSDGVEKLRPGEADTVVIAGMGGELVIHILDAGRHLWGSVRQWVLSPQSELDKVRRYLQHQGFSIVREGMLKEDGKYYTVMDVVWEETGPGEAKAEGLKAEGMRPEEYLYGRYLIQEKNPVLQEFLKKEQIQMEKIIEQLAGQASEASKERRDVLQEQLGWLKEAQNEMR